MMQDFDPLKNPSLQKALIGLRQLSTSLRSASGSLAPAFGQRSRTDAFDSLHVPASDTQEPPENSSSGSSAQYSAQLQRFKDELQRAEYVDFTNLRAFAFHGIPDQGPLRATAWKVQTSHAPWRHNASCCHLLYSIKEKSEDAARTCCSCCSDTCHQTRHSGRRRCSQNEPSMPDSAR